MLGRKREKPGFFARFLGFFYGTRAQIGRPALSVSARSIDAGPHQRAKVARIPRGFLPRAHPRRVFAGRWGGQTAAAPSFGFLRLLQKKPKNKTLICVNNTYFSTRGDVL